MNGSARLDVPYDEAALHDLGPWIEAFVEANKLRADTAFALQLCLEEAVSNAVRHGVPSADSRGVVLTVNADAAGVVARLEDHGPPFDPLQAAPPKMPNSLEDAIPGGLGIHLMREFCKDISYARVGRINRLTFVFPA
jgi:anti-sigma regulatory factor (Ser/Thr protein kinase)